MNEITEDSDGELLIDGKPVDYQAPWKVEDAIRQLRADIAERDAVISACAQTVGATISPECSPEFRAMLPAEIKSVIAERDARIAGLHSTCEYARQTVADLDAELTRLREDADFCKNVCNWRTQ